MFSYYTVLKNVATTLSSSSGVVNAFSLIDSTPVRFYIGIDVNNPPSTDDGPVCIINPSVDPVDEGNGVNERQPKFVVEWWFKQTLMTTSGNLVILDGFEDCDNVGVIIVDTLVNYFRTLGYEFSKIDYTILPITDYPDFCGLASFELIGYRTLNNDDPSFV